MDFQTDVDNLMKAIQSRQPRKDEKSPSPAYPQHRSPVKAEAGFVTERNGFAAGFNNGWPQQQQQQQQQPQPSQPQQRVGSSPEIHQIPCTGVNKMLTRGEAGSPQEGKKDEKKSPKQKKRYECTVVGCGKSFFQKTHLDIHSRAHTGDKPFVRPPPMME